MQRMFTIGYNANQLTQYDITQIPKRGVSLQAHIADIHFGVMDPKTEYNILYEQFIQVIGPLPLEIIAIDGDVFYRLMTGNSDAILYANLLVQKLAEKCIHDGTTLFILAGTKQHDAGQLKIFYPYLNTPGLDIRIIEHICFEYTHGMKILCIPELYGIPEEQYQEVLFRSGFYDMCYMHGTIKGAIYGNNVGEGRLFTIDDFCNCLGPIISGHVHTGGCFDKYFYYTGSPVRWSFGEEGEKGFLIVLYDKDTHYHYVHLQPIYSFRYDTISVDHLVNGDPKEIVSYIDNLKSQGIDHIRIQYTRLDEADIPSMSVVKDYYKTDSTIKFKEDKIQTKTKPGSMARDADDDLAVKFSYLFSDSLSPYEKLARYITEQSGTIVSADQIKELVEE